MNNDKRPLFFPVFLFMTAQFFLLCIGKEVNMCLFVKIELRYSRYYKKSWLPLFWILFFGRLFILCKIHSSNIQQQPETNNCSNIGDWREGITRQTNFSCRNYLAFLNVRLFTNKANRTNYQIVP